MLKQIEMPTMIAEGTRIQGELTFYSGVAIFGIVEGDIIQQSRDILQVGRNGWVNGTLRSQGPVVIEGRVEGEVFSSTSIRLTATAVVKGKLVAPAVDVRPGALFEGELTMLGETKARRIKRAA
jgi:cytoskeletal protein CcmA (bactofilin family)